MILFQKDISHCPQGVSVESYVEKIVWLLENMMNSFAALCGTRKLCSRKRAKRWLNSSAFATAFGYELMVEYLISKDANVKVQKMSG